MVSAKTQRHRQPAVKLLLRDGRNWLLFALSGAIVLSGDLAFSAWDADLVAFCTEGSGCDVVLNRHWSTLFGVPALFSDFKRAVKRSVIKIRDGIRQLDEEPREKISQDHDYEQDDFVYPWLNSIFTKVLSEDRALRPNYTWGVLQGAHLAKAIGIDRVSIIEFGVAGGNGLISLERVAKKIEAIFGLGIDVYGFDTGIGLPKPQDYRDLPNLYVQAAFPGNVEKLKKRLTKAQLIVGLVENTVPEFIASNPAPVAFISFDLDYYSSTMHAFKLLEAAESVLLPRIHCYFDDIMGFTFSDFNGARLAISEFNASHSMRKISPIYGLRDYVPSGAAAWWADRFYIAHSFDHSLYCKYDGLVRRPFGSTTDLND